MHTQINAHSGNSACANAAGLPGSSLRPDLAAFFVLSSRELAPRRLAAEHGVLAELRIRRGYE